MTKQNQGVELRGKKDGRRLLDLFQKLMHLPSFFPLNSQYQQHIVIANEVKQSVVNNEYSNKLIRNFQPNEIDWFIP